MNKLVYKYRSNGLGGFVDLERLRFPSLCGEDVSLVCVPAGLLLVSAAVLSGELSGGRVILHLGVTGFRISWCNSVTAGVIFSIAQISLRLLFILLRGFEMELTVFYYRGQGLLLLIEFLIVTQSFKVHAASSRLVLRFLRIWVLMTASEVDRAEAGF